MIKVEILLFYTLLLQHPVNFTNQTDSITSRCSEKDDNFLWTIVNKSPRGLITKAFSCSHVCFQSRITDHLHMNIRMQQMKTTMEIALIYDIILKSENCLLWCFQVRERW
ncbi:unnamed protein product [Brassica oleracea]|uniref:(rape) hypothetical protein n=1 Tax=Brassica napus TaxID=3708 RepID=A0A816M384_BRANA|nr:unnamed protein product [Brassica napus]